MTTTYVTTPSTDELEAAWFELMQGELGLEHDGSGELVELMRSMAAHLRRLGEDGAIFEDGEPVTGAISSMGVARRLVAAYSTLVYGS